MSLLLLFRPRGGGGPPPPPPPAAAPPSGVKHQGPRRPTFRIRLGELPREDTAEFLKRELRERHTLPLEESRAEQRRATEDRRRLAAIAKREAAMRAKAEEEARLAAAQEAERKAVEAYNAEIMKIIFLSEL